MASSCRLLLVLPLLLQRFIFLLISASNVHIVYMGERRHHDYQLTQDSHHEILSTLLGSKQAARESILYSYKHGFSGFAALLTQSQAKLIADFPGVVRVIPNRILRVHTTRSWDFLQLKPEIMDGILSRSQSGYDSIIGVLDTGIWPESESFKDDGMGEVPSRWNGVCQEGEEFNASNCNRKVIGARWYIKGYAAEFGKLNTSGDVEFLSPRDAVGHGTHTSSTAAGALVGNASFMGLAQGLARGGAPAARLSIYKVCWSTGGCSSADLLAAFDDAISDGVDVLSVSLGSPPPLSPYIEDALAIGSFHVVAKGIPVVCSGGNSGPSSQTVINTAPWIITVAASTIDRSFPTTIILGNNLSLVGQALLTEKHVNKFYPIVYGESIASNDSDEDKARSCDAGSLNATLARGKVVLCFQSRLKGSASIATKTVARVRGVGVIFAQFPTKDIASTSGIPCVQVDYTIGTSVLTYIESTRNPVVRFSLTTTSLGRQISPEVAFFSSRGPSSISPSVLKPDIAAPGVNILASWSPASSLSPGVHRHKQPSLKFKIESGTSMSCPHVSGIVALLKSMHPNWSPAAIKSALVTTASTKDKYGQSAVAEGSPHKQADPFDYGGGHVDPNKAADPGLIYDMGITDHVRFLCLMGYNDSSVSLMTRHPTVCSKTSKSLADLNLPSISIPELKKSLAVSRTVTNVGPVNSVYSVHVKAPPGVIVHVNPSVLSFNSTAKQLRFKVTFQSQLSVQGRYSFGSLSWEDGIHVVRIPLIVRTVIDDFYADI
ncbi:PREDICTED: subtilisin-like protease SBT3.9 isoform X2 [Nelumbo nucifera]|uniref:Subtilisin-like protease SBT3.9 isoform X2 n=1 Tax=Nelumbo nucifera TaxID=4432 RepID=A0A1U8ATW8_NELNU|nr:PREDICTED: subtilisin-like protease SBT3.9 isoform X2 [Nelumbo nucifera]